MATLYAYLASKFELNKDPLKNEMGGGIDQLFSANQGKQIVAGALNCSLDLCLRLIQ